MKEKKVEIANPMVDCVFKKIFGSEKNKNLLKSLINAIIKGNEPQIVELEILNPYNLQDFYKDKMSILDIKAKNEKEEWFIIEVQVEMTMSFPKRLLYYWAKNYQGMLKEGEEYSGLKKVSVICICEKELPIETKQYLNCFKVLEKTSLIEFSKDLNIYTIELSKFIANEVEIKSEAEVWSYFLKNGKELEEETLPEKLKVPEIIQAVKECRMFTQNEIERDLYESRLKEQRDRLSLLKDRYEEGKQKGEQIGKQIGIQEGKQIGIQEGKQIGIQEGENKKARENAMEALKIGLDMETIRKITGLSIEEIKELKR